jgi:hypothetical protein
VPNPYRNPWVAIKCHVYIRLRVRVYINCGADDREGITFVAKLAPREPIMQQLRPIHIKPFRSMGNRAQSGNVKLLPKYGMPEDNAPTTESDLLPANVGCVE